MIDSGAKGGRANEGERRREALALMEAFAERTGLGSSGRMPDRYLWTDAFAVCNWLGLGETESALRLVNEVHHVLGRHRDDDPRRGPLGGLDDQTFEAHPTRGGLRIGKKEPERARGEPFDERREWDRDGQYFHYLTRWMHALDRVSRTTRQPAFNGWARELAVVAHDAFTYEPPRLPGRKRMHWKMSIDLSRPLVASMGQHDPLDGFLTCLQLDATAAALDPKAAPLLGEIAADFASMIEPRLETADPLGLGGLLVDAHRAHVLTRATGAPGDDFVRRLLAAALAGLRHWAASGDLRRPASHRLAFRELGLAIGLAALESLERAGAEIGELAATLALRESIETFWRHEPHRREASWLDHANINDVMLATSLVPAGYVELPPVS